MTTQQLKTRNTSLSRELNKAKGEVQFYKDKNLLLKGNAIADNTQLNYQSETITRLLKDVDFYKNLPVNRWSKIKFSVGFILGSIIGSAILALLITIS